MQTLGFDFNIFNSIIIFTIILIAFYRLLIVPQEKSNSSKFEDSPPQKNIVKYFWWIILSLIIIFSVYGIFDLYNSYQIFFPVIYYPWVIISFLVVYFFYLVFTDPQSPDKFLQNEYTFEEYKNYKHRQWLQNLGTCCERLINKKQWLYPFKWLCVNQLMRFDINNELDSRIRYFIKLINSSNLTEIAKGFGYKINKYDDPNVITQQTRKTLSLIPRHLKSLDIESLNSQLLDQLYDLFNEENDDDDNE